MSAVVEFYTRSVESNTRECCGMGLDGRTLDDGSRWRRSAGVLLIVVFASGCVNPFATTLSRPVLRPMTTQTGSDRLRDHAAQAPPPEVRRAAQPITLTPARQPEPQPPSSPVGASPSSRPGEPDPRAVIDWLLNERR
jgi:hypothetical protein